MYEKVMANNVGIFCQHIYMPSWSHKGYDVYDAACTA